MKKSKKTKVTTPNKCACGSPIETDEFICDECADDLYYGIYRNISSDMKVYTMEGEIDVDDYIEIVIKRGIGPVGKCCICGKNYIRGGNNPKPVNMENGARCCYRCNDEYVLPARIDETLNKCGKI